MPPTPNLTAGEVMNAVASALLNDAARSIYTYSAQIPMLNVALQELQEYFELNNVPVTDTVTSNPIEIAAGVNRIKFDAANPHLPNDLIEPKILWEREHDVDPYTQMRRLDSLPRYMAGVEINQFIYYTWQSQEIRFLPANQINDIKIDYIRRIFNPVLNELSTLNVINSQSFLEFRTGALCAEFIGENKTRADDLNAYASLSLDRVVGIGTKGRQAIITRHRPFRSSYKRRTYM